MSLKVNNSNSNIIIIIIVKVNKKFNISTFLIVLRIREGKINS